jgi:tetratricopeptide (TPR) repeat protein
VAGFSEEAYGDDNIEMRLLDGRLATVMALPEMPSNITDLHITDDGAVLRGVSEPFLYEFSINVPALRGRAEARLASWAVDDEMQAHLAQSSEAQQSKDWDRNRAIVERARERFPDDPTILLYSANATKWGAPEQVRQKLALYDKSIAGDPYNAISYYMRGKARAAAGDQSGAAEDFRIAIELPHVLPNVEVIAGSLGINSGIAKLSRTLNRQSTAELHLRRAMALAWLKDWNGVLEHTSVLDVPAFATPLVYDLEGFAYAGSGKLTDAIRSYGLAAKGLERGRHYGLEEFEKQSRRQAWRHLKSAELRMRIGRLYQELGAEREARDAFTTARGMVQLVMKAPDFGADLENPTTELAENIDALLASK